MEGGRDALLAGDLRTARHAFAAAEASFAEGRALARHPVIRLVSYLPYLGRTPDTVDGLAASGELVARGAHVATSAVFELPGGLGDLAPKEGAVPVDALEQIAPALDEGLRLLLRANEELHRTESSFLLPQVAEARSELEIELADAIISLSKGAALAREMPEFLGADGRRRYFLGAQNPAELRGTGGFIGSYTILTVNDGRIHLGPFAAIQDLPNLKIKDDIPVPNESFGRRYRPFGSHVFWFNINLTPDFPSAAQMIETLYSEVRGEDLDGAILVDPFAFQALLGITGPVEVPGTGFALSSENAVSFLTNEAYSAFTDQNTRKLILGAAAGLVFDRFLELGAANDPVGAARTLIDVAAQGHLLLHSADPGIQRSFERAGIAGALLQPEGDFLGVFSNNFAGNKIDYFLDTTIRYRVKLKPDGSASAVASVELKNDAPLEGQPQYVIGPYREEFKAGENRTYLSTYCAAGCRLESFRGGTRFHIGSDKELGHPVFSRYVVTRSGETATLEYEWTLPEGWERRVGTGRYQLWFQGQPTIRPTQLKLEIVAPGGAVMTRGSPGLSMEGKRAEWSGETGNLEHFEVEFRT